MSSESGRTHNEVSREHKNMEDRQSFPIGSIDSTVGDSSQRGESRPRAAEQEIWSRGFQLFYAQPIARQPEPGEQFQVGDHLAQSVSVTTVQPPTVNHHVQYQL